MSTPVTVVDLFNAFFREREHQLQPFVDQAESAGQTQLAKVFRAVIASDRYRNHLMQTHLPEHFTHTDDYFVCPYCGLIFEPEAPETCLIDETPGEQFEHIA